AIVLSQGWPHSFVELLARARLLPEFHVVIPSLPGDPCPMPLPTDGPFPSVALGERPHRLLTALGSDRELTHRADGAASAIDALASRHPEAVEGLFATHAYFPPASEREDLSTAETAFFDWLGTRWDGASGYAAIQGTRPDTLAAGLSDSP